MKFGEIFWGEVKIDTLKGGGDASKRETIIYYFLAVKYLKQQVVITNEK